jgi:TonB family protein
VPSRVQRVRVASGARRPAGILAGLCLALLAAGADPAAQIEVHPRAICADAGHWTFLLSGLPPDPGMSVVVAAGQVSAQGYLSQSYTSSSSLWEFYFEPLDTTARASLAIRAAPGDTAALFSQPLTWTGCLSPDSALVQGSAALWPAPGRLRFRPGKKVRGLDELIGADPRIVSRFRQLGIRQIWKVVDSRPDTLIAGPCPARAPAAPPHGLSADQLYMAAFSEAHQPEAVALVLRALPCVQWASAQMAFTPDSLASFRPQLLSGPRPESPPGVAVPAGGVHLTLLLDVDARGRVTAARVHDSPGIAAFERAALDAARQYRYAPLAPGCEQVQLLVPFDFAPAGP